MTEIIGKTEFGDSVTVSDAERQGWYPAHSERVVSTLGGRELVEFRVIKNDDAKAFARYAPTLPARFQSAALWITPDRRDWRAGTLKDVLDDVQSHRAHWGVYRRAARQVPAEIDLTHAGVRARMSEGQRMALLDAGFEHIQVADPNLKYPGMPTVPAFPVAFDDLGHAVLGVAVEADGKVFAYLTDHEGWWGKVAESQKFDQRDPVDSTIPRFVVRADADTTSTAEMVNATMAAYGYHDD